MKIKLATLLLAVLCAATAFAQVFTDVEPPYPRFAAIGATVAMAGDPAMPYFNPAGIVTMKNAGGSFAFTRPYTQNFYTLYSANGAYPLKNDWGVVGVSLLNGGVNYKSTSLSNETALAVSHAVYLQRDINTDLAFGYSAKILSQSFGTSINGTSLGSATTVGLDAGFRATLWQRTRIGMRVTNINHPSMGSLYDHTLPSVINAGFAYTPYRGVMSGIELEKTLGGEQMLKGGVELEVDPHLDLRLGIRSNPNRISLGVGVKDLYGFRADLAYLTHPSLPSTFLIGLGYGY